MDSTINVPIEFSQQPQIYFEGPVREREASNSGVSYFKVEKQGKHKTLHTLEEHNSEDITQLGCILALLYITSYSTAYS